MKIYDSIIIGFGKGGKTLAYDLAHNHNQKVAIIEESNKMYGGTCINIGCIPTKRMVYDSNKSTKDLEYYEKSIKAKNIFIANLRQKNYDRVISGNVDVIDGSAKFISKNEIEVFYKNKKSQIFKANHFFINTGAKTVVPKINGIKSKFVYDSTKLQQLKKLPKKLIIIGAGYIGCEFASIYNNFGSKIILLETSNSFLPREEEIISNEIRECFKKNKIELITNVEIEKINSSKNKTSISIKVNDKKMTLNSNAILYSVGRKPNIEHLDLEKAGVKVNEYGKIEVNKHLQTSQPNIYVMGDAVGNLQFTYISLDDYRIIKSHLFDNGKYNLEMRKNIPYSMFIDPAFARVGITEKEAISKGFKVKTNVIKAAQIVKANVIKNPAGVLKVIIDQETDLILGAHLLVENSYEIINLIKMAMDNKIKYTYIKNQIFTHPTISEGLNDLFDI